MRVARACVRALACVRSCVCVCVTDNQYSLFENLIWKVLSFFFFQLPDDFELMFDEAAGEITIGGIYLRLFIQQPAWVSSLNS